MKINKKVWDNFIKENQKKFERLNATEAIIELQFENDFSMLLELFLDWSKKAKNKKQKQLIFKANSTLLNIRGYVLSLQTISKQSVIIANESKHESKKLLKKIDKLRRTVAQLKTEIKGYENK